MGLLVGGEVAAAERAYAWCLATQRADGSWPMKVVAGVVDDASGETNMSAYLAVGVRNDDHPLAKAYHRLLVWEIMKDPKALRLAGKVLDPVIGKSMVLYFRKPDAA